MQCTVSHDIVTTVWIHRMASLFNAVSKITKVVFKGYLD